MLIEYTVSNYKTIRDQACLSMVAEKIQGNKESEAAVFTPINYKEIPLLRSAVIYGANASGKTNLLQSLVTFRTLILDSIDTKFGEWLPFHPFALETETAEQPTTFELEFIALDGIRYVYGFSYNREEILEEHLIAFAHNNRRSEVYIREKGKPIKFGSSFKGPKKSLEEQLQSNHLLLTKASNSNFVQFHPIYQFFRTKFPVLFSKWENSAFTKNKAFREPRFLEIINAFMRFADTGIDALSVRRKAKETDDDLELDGKDRDRPDDGDTFEAIVNHQVKDKNGKPISISWPMDQESTGTRRLFALAGPIVDVLSQGAVLLLDELNNHFHPMLSEFLVNLFNNSASNPHNAQLIFTTHDVSLLKKENFRRDQIWFIEKDYEGSSRLFPLSAFDKKVVRWDIPFDKWYLSGKFGATPLIQDFDLLSK